MRGLGEIIRANDRAAGREAGHADNDWKDELASAIHQAQHEQDKDTDNPEFITGYLQGRTEG
jgi:hypothetical protein